MLEVIGNKKENARGKLSRAKDRKNKMNEKINLHKK